MSRSRRIRWLVVPPMILGAVFSFTIAILVALPIFVLSVIVFRSSRSVLKTGAWPRSGVVALVVLNLVFGTIAAYAWAWLIMNSGEASATAVLVLASALSVWFVPFVWSTTALLRPAS